MLRSIKELRGFAIHSRDGEIGRIEEIFFKDDDWIVRYLVIDLGSWLAGRRGLIAPEAVQRIDIESDSVYVSLSREQVQKSPEIDADRPISREREQVLHEHFQWQPSWVPGLNLPPRPGAFPPAIASVQRGQARESDLTKVVLQKAESNLRSSGEVVGYTIQASDGSIGQVEDFIFDDESWMIHYMVVDTHNWLPGRKVLVAPAWVKQVQWTERNVHVGLTMESIRRSPEFRPDILISPDYSDQLYEHYREWFKDLIERETA